jgi:hypothetical protein
MSPGPHLPPRPAPMARPPVVGPRHGRPLGGVGRPHQPGRPWPGGRCPLALVFRRPARPRPTPVLRSAPGGPVQVSLRFALTLHLAERIRTVIGIRPTGSTTGDQDRAATSGSAPWRSERWWPARTQRSAVAWLTTRWRNTECVDRPVGNGWRRPAVGAGPAGPGHADDRRGPGPGPEEPTLSTPVPGQSARTLRRSMPPTDGTASSPRSGPGHHRALWPSVTGAGPWVAMTSPSEAEPEITRSSRPGVTARDHDLRARPRRRTRTAVGGFVPPAPLDLAHRPRTRPAKPAPAGSEPDLAGGSTGRRLPVEQVHRHTQPSVPAVSDAPTEVQAPAPSPAPVDLDRLDQDLWKRFEKRIRIEQERRGRR